MNDGDFKSTPNMTVNEDVITGIFILCDENKGRTSMQDLWNIAFAYQ